MKTTCSERTKDSTTPVRTAGCRARSGLGVIVNDCDRSSPLWAGTNRGNQNPRRLTSTVPSRAVPQAAPMLRKKLTAEVELPEVAAVHGVLDGHDDDLQRHPHAHAEDHHVDDWPRPGEVWSPRWVKSHIPTVMSAVPTHGIDLVAAEPRHQLVPEMIDVVSIPPMSGSRSTPERVADTPSTSCR